jgi:hypothetical protein
MIAIEASKVDSHCSILPVFAKTVFERKLNNFVRAVIEKLAFSQ